MARAKDTTRRKTRRQLERASGNLDVAMSHLLIVRDTYKAEHPDISDAANSIMLGVLKMQELIDNFRIAL